MTNRRRLRPAATVGLLLLLLATTTTVHAQCLNLITDCLTCNPLSTCLSSSVDCSFSCQCPSISVNLLGISLIAVSLTGPTCNTCAPGFAQDPANLLSFSCSLNINECASTPCQNGGSCVDYINKYQCLCVSGYSGANCEVSDVGGSSGGTTGAPPGGVF